MTDEPIYRRASPEDLACLSLLATQVFLDTYATQGINAALAGEVATVLSVAAFQARLSGERVELFVAERAGHLVGFLDLDFHSTCPVRTVHGCEVLRLYVQQPFQGQGIGRRLLALAEARARHAGQAAVWLTAWEGNHRARDFYQALGYRDLGATAYVIDGQAYGNRVLVKRW